MNRNQMVLAIVVISGFIFITSLYFFNNIPENIPSFIKEHLGLIVGWWGAAFITVINWVFGSSQGSADKNKLLFKDKNTS